MKCTQANRVGEGNLRNLRAPRGIDMIQAERVYSQIPNDEIVAGGPKKQFPLYDGHGNMVASLIRTGTNDFGLVNERRIDAWGTVMPNTPPGEALAKPSEAYCANLGRGVRADLHAGSVKIG